MVSSVCGGNQVRSTKTSLSCLQSSMVVEVSWSGAAWVLPALGSYSSLREPWMPTCTVTYWSRAWSAPFGDWAAGQYSNMIMTTALLKKLRVKVICEASSNGKGEERKVSNIHQLQDVIMEECELWWTPCPRGLRQCWKIMVTKILIFLGQFGLTFMASGLDINGCVLSYFEGTANLHCYTSCTLTTLHCSKV